MTSAQALAVAQEACPEECQVACQAVRQVAAERAAARLWRRSTEQRNCHDFSAAANEGLPRATQLQQRLKQQSLQQNSAKSSAAAM